MGTAKLRITPEFLCDLLNLPQGTYILGSVNDREQVTILVQHADLTPNVDDHVPFIDPTFTRQPAVVMTDWGQMT